MHGLPVDLGDSHVERTTGWHASTGPSDARELNILDFGMLDVYDRLVNEDQGALQGVEMPVAGLDGAFDGLLVTEALELSWDEDVYLGKVLEQFGQHIIQGSFDLLLEFVIVLLFELLFRQIDLHLLELFLLKLQRDEVVQGLPLTERCSQLEDVGHMDAIRLGQKETLADVLVQYFVIVCAAVQLGEVAVHVERVLSTGDYHGQLGQGSDHLSSELTDTGGLDDLLVEDLGGSDLLLFLFAFFILIL